MAFGTPYQNYMQPGGYYGQQNYGQPMPDQLAQWRQSTYPQQQAQQPMQQPVTQPAPQNQQIIWVQGEEGAKAYMVAAGNSVLLMDSETSTFYIKTTDNSGMPQPLRIFDYTERKAQQKQAVQEKAETKDYVTREEFDALAAKFETLTAKKKKEAVSNAEPSV